MGLLESFLAALHLTPLDIKHLARSSLSAGQNSNFHVSFHELADEQAQQNHMAEHPEITEEMLLEESPHSDLISQLTILEQAYQQMALMMKQAWVTIPEEGIPTQSFFTHSLRSWEPQVPILSQAAGYYRHKQQRLLCCIWLLGMLLRIVSSRVP